MAGNKKSDKLRRLVDVQRQLEKLAEFELSTTVQRKAEIVQSIDTTVDALSSTDPVHQQFSKNYADRLTRLFSRSQQIVAQQKAQEQRVLREKTKGDRLEERMGDAKELEGRLAEDERMYDLVDLGLMVSTPASSKLDKG